MSNDKEILFVAFDAGGGTVLLPILRKILHEKKDYRCIVVAGGPAKRLFETDHAASKLPIYGSSDNESISKKHRIKLVVSGTGISGFETEVWRFWQARNVPVFSVIDGWNKLNERYILPSGEKAVTDYIGVPDREAKQSLEGCGFPPSRIHVVGQPYLESLAHDIMVEKGKRKGLRSRLGIPDGTFAILFASEQFGPGYDYGYNEYDVLKEIVSACSMLSAGGLKPELVIKFHPEEKRDKYDSFQFPRNFMTKILKDDIPPRDAIASADLVCGSTSIILLESFMFGTPTLSIQPGLNVEDNCRASQLHLIPLLCRRGELGVLLSDVLVKKKKTFEAAGLGKKPVFEKGATDRIIKLIDSILSGNHG